MISAVNSSYYDGAFDVDGAAAKAGFDRPIAYPFKVEEYPGYSPVNTKNPSESALRVGLDFVTFVLSPKRPPARTGRGI